MSHVKSVCFFFFIILWVLKRLITLIAANIKHDKLIIKARVSAQKSCLRISDTQYNRQVVTSVLPRSRLFVQHMSCVILDVTVLLSAPFSSSSSVSFNFSFFASTSLLLMFYMLCPVTYFTPMYFLNLFLHQPIRHLVVWSSSCFSCYSRWARCSPVPPGRPAVLLISTDRYPFWDGQFCRREYSGRPASLCHTPRMYD